MYRPTIKTDQVLPNLSYYIKLIKSPLSLSHGNADVERGFSENAALITDDRSSISDISINRLRATKDAVKFYRQGKVHEVSETIK